jgi:hypothetical protein
LIVPLSLLGEKRGFISDQATACLSGANLHANCLVNIDLRESISRRWREAALSGDLALAWSISDEFLQANLDRSAQERWCCPLWDGSPIDGRNVLIRCWRGLGDAIHFIRYAPAVRERARELAVEAPRILIPLFETVPGIDCLLILDADRSYRRDCVEIESTELPYVFRTTLNSIPSAVPYLNVPGYDRPAYRRLSSIGLCWSSGPFDPRRSMRLFELEPLGDLSDTLFFQLQRGPAFGEVARTFLIFENPDDCSMDLMRTASLIASLDVVISVDTMVAHLAGALGKSTYLLLHSDADWRWFREREDSPWYPTMRVLRQTNSGNWEPVVDKLAELLMECLKPKERFA